MPRWEIHTGCIPCAFVCDSCHQQKHRCGAGETMWVYNKRSGYGDCDRMQCDDCYHGRQPPAQAGDCPIEVDRSMGTRTVCEIASGVGCCNCYYFSYPCGQCEGPEMVMTYEEFRKNSSFKDELPETYEEFLKNEDHPTPQR